MNEQQRADFVARAVDDLISGIETTYVPAALDARDVDAIMQVARSRLASARSTANDGIHHEGTVWQRVLEKLGSAGTVMPQGTLAGRSPQSYDLSDEQALREMAFLRRQMSAQLHAFAAAHREEVWRRVQARIATQAAGEAPAGVFHRARKRLLARLSGAPAGQAYADLVAPALDSVAKGRPAVVGDPDLDDVIRVAWSRKAATQMAASNAEARRDRVWGRVHANITTGHSTRHAAAGRAWPRALAIGAAAAVVIAAVGPLPATGFADHPAAHAIRFVGGHIGVVEAGTPPAPTGGDSVDGSSATAQEASSRLGFTVAQPRTPDGFDLVSAEVFPTGITSTGGVYAVSFSGPAERTITVYQEAASSASLAASGGSATDITLADGTRGTYFDGRWQVSDGSFAWVLGGTQTLVFDRNGVRTIVVHSGPSATGFLTDFAGTIGAP